MGTTKIELYNGALGAIGDKRLVSLTENRDARRALDDVYDNVLALCLEAGFWQFAKRTGKFAADTTVTVNFGKDYIIAKPSDWVRTIKMSLDDRFTDPYLTATDEVGYWATDDTPLYIMYVSNDSSYGGDLTAWPESYVYFVQLSLARRVANRITQDKSLTFDALDRDLKMAKMHALNISAMREGVQFAPEGNWTSARRSGRSRERGNRSSLTG